MTYSISIFGSMTDLNDEATIEEKARGLVASLSGVSGATLNTTHGGSVDLTVDKPLPTEADPEIESTEQ